MNWHQVLQGDPGPGVPLRQRIELLFEQQRETWPALRAGEAALEQLRRKVLAVGGETIVVQFNPARRRSTLAPTDAQAVAARPCFLCPQSMPMEERGVAFEDLVVLPNPYPVLPLHCTIAAVEHRPQRLAGRIGTFLQLADAIGPELATLYNGPRCGASAPDHFHFQAVRADGIPLLEQLPSSPTGQRVAAYKSFGRNMVVIEADDATAVESVVRRSVEALGRRTGGHEEPLFNLMAIRRTGRFMVVLFPRAAHRPACYFAEGPARLAVSPAVLEMCGVVVTTEPGDDERIVAETAHRIYDEVVVPFSVVHDIVAEVG